MANLFTMRQEAFSKEKLSQSLAYLSTLIDMCEGAIAVDLDANITWINQRYIRLLGLDDMSGVIGRPIEEVIPESRLRQVVKTGKPILLDLMCFGTQNFVVCRLPLLDSRGQLEGAIGFVFYHEPEYLKPLLDKFESLNSQLDDATQALLQERKAKYRLSQYRGISEAVKEIKVLARQWASSEGSILIEGETGVGKELLAHAIHLSSPAADGPFVALNMSTMQIDRIDNEFFGSVSGGVHTSGRLELAANGTLFLDDVGDIPPVVQSKLLRVLENGEYERAGSSELLKSNVRIIAATNQDLEVKITADSFRSDLYFRLNVLPLKLPPLRERPEDIELLCEHFLDEIPHKDGFGAWRLTRRAMELLRKYSWPGNVRELKNTIHRMTLSADTNVIDDMNVYIAVKNIKENPQEGLKTLLETREREILVKSLRENAWNKEAAAEQLGISRSQFYSKMKKYDIKSGI